MRLTRNRIVRPFIAGLIAALPLAATTLIIVWAVRLLYEWVGPGSLLGRLLIAIGVGITGSEFVGYLLGVAMVMLGIFGGERE